MKAASAPPRRTSRMIREQYDSRSTCSSAAFDEFKDLFARKIIEDEMLWRELTDRYGEYFEGGMGAQAIAHLIEALDLDEEEVKLRAAIDPAGGPAPPVGPAQAEGHQAAQDRLGVQPPRRERQAHQRPAGDDPRRRAGDPAGAPPDGAARRWPASPRPTSTTSTAG
jgi:DNA-directed RNA polymerase subunit beta'